MTREEFLKKRRAYLDDHKACPKCNRTKFTQSLRAVVWNYVTCECGFEGSIHCLVAEKEGQENAARK